MFDSAIVEVIIGLVFVYILLSIICSGLTELIAAKLLSLRSKNLQDALRSMLSDEELLKKFNEHPLIRGLTKPGENPSYIPSDIFARALLDILKFENPDKAIDSAISAIPHEDMKKLLRTLTQDVRADMSNIQKNLSEWYDDSMERFSGWYQRKAQIITYIVAISVVIVLNVDTFTIANKLWIDEELRENIVHAAENFNKEQNSPLDTDTKNNDIEVKAGEMKKKIELANAELAALGLPVGWDFGEKYYLINDNNINGLKSNQVIQSEPCLKDLTASLEKLKDENINSADFSSSVKLETPACGVAAYKPFLDKHDQLINDTFKACSAHNLLLIVKGSVFSHWLGWLFTAMAVSLGAPFWFDILNKIINARIAGKKPEEEKLQNANK